MRSSNSPLLPTIRSPLDSNTAGSYPGVTKHKLSKLIKWPRIMSIHQIFKRRYPRKQQCSFLDLPLEIFYTITDGLTLPQKIILSQTCSDLYYLLHDDCLSTFRKVSLAERLDCLAVLGLSLPDHRLCIDCCALHLLDYQDLPIVIPIDRFGKGLYRRFCPSHEPLFSRFLPNGSYAIAFRHVQLAIKYTNHQGPHQQYHTALLRKFSISIPDFFSFRLDFSAEPLIAKGRFLLKTTHVFYSGTEPLSLASALKVPVTICPHLCPGPMPIDLAEAFPVALRQAYDRADAPVDRNQDLHTCAQCPTDFLVSYKDDNVCIMVWTDLGSGTSPQDPFWRSHLRDSRNDHFDRTNFDYRPGSIREMYYGNNY